MRDVFDLPDLGAMDDGIANGTHEPRRGEAHPLSLFTAPRVDYSLHRLRHYTGTAPEHFQNFVLFTNYQFYIDEFVRLGHETMSSSAHAQDYVAFVEPGNVVTRRAGLPARPGDELGTALVAREQLVQRQLAVLHTLHQAFEFGQGLLVTGGFLRG